MAKTSEVPVLLWGHDLFVLGPTGVEHSKLPARSDPVSAAGAVLCSLSVRPKAVRLIYQLADLEVHSENTPPGSRRSLRAVFQMERNTITSPETSWACLDPRPLEAGGYSTVLFIDQKPRLQRLDKILAGKGITLIGAWPLARLIEQLPDVVASDQGSVVIVSVLEHVMTYCAPVTNDRTVACQDGPGANDSAGSDVSRALSLFDAPIQPIVVAHGAPAAWPALEGFSVARHDLTALLAETARLPLDSPGNFLASDARFTTSTVCRVAVFVSAAAAIAFAILGFQARSVAETETRRLAQIRADLRAEVAALGANRTKAEQLKSVLSQANLETLGRARFIEAISKASPPSVTLQSLRISEQGYVITGTVADGLGQKTGPFFTLVDALVNPPEGLWLLPPESRPESVASQEFTLSGRFTRSAPLVTPR